MLADDVVWRSEERAGVGSTDHRQIVVGITGGDDLEVERAERLDGTPFVVVDPQHVVDDVVVADLEAMTQDDGLPELLHERRRELLERVTQEHHLIPATESIEKVPRPLERPHLGEHLAQIGHSDPLPFEDLESVRHELVVVGFVTGRAAKIVDACSDGEIDPHLRDENPLDIEGHQFLQPHGRGW